MKIKRIFLDMIITMASLSLIASLVIILSNNLDVYGVKSAQFNFEQMGNLLSIQSFDVTKSSGNIGALGICISVICLVLPCIIAFYQTKNKHYCMGLGYIIPLVMIILPIVIKNNIVNMIGYFFLILYVNPYYTLLSILPFNPTLNIYIGYGIITLLIILSTIVGVIYNKLKINLD